MTDSFMRDDDDPVGDPYGVRFEPDDPEELWEEYCHELRERHADRWEWFRAKARRANRRAVERGDGGRITTCDVAALFEKAGGRCHYCGSLADQVCPPEWGEVGRRVGSIDHVDQRGIRNPGAEVETFIWNDTENLVWCCHWCNTHRPERRPGATDHGGLQPR